MYPLEDSMSYDEARFYMLDFSMIVSSEHIVSLTVNSDSLMMNYDPSFDDNVCHFLITARAPDPAQS